MKIETRPVPQKTLDEIVRRIVEKLGGQVGVESEGIPGKGSTFYFTIPIVL